MSSPWSNPSFTTAPLTPPTTSPDPSPPPRPPFSPRTAPLPAHRQHKTTHTTAPSASVCVNCTGPPLEYPFPYPFLQRQHHHSRIPDLDVFNLAGTIRAWDDADDEKASRNSPSSSPRFTKSTDTDPPVEHLASTLTVSVALPLRHDPYADGEAAPDVVPFLTRVKAAPPPPHHHHHHHHAPPSRPTPPQMTCPKAPRLRPVRIDADADVDVDVGDGGGMAAKRGAPKAGERGEGGAAAAEIEGWSLDGDGDGDGDGDDGDNEAAVGVVGLKTHALQRAGAREEGEGREKEGRMGRTRGRPDHGASLGSGRGEGGGRAGKAAARARAKL